MRSAWIAPAVPRLDDGVHAEQPATDLGLAQPDRGGPRLARGGGQRTGDRRPRQVEIPAHVHAVAEQPGQIAPQHGQFLQRGAADIEGGLEPASLERQRERDRHRAEVEVARDEGVAQVQTAVVDLVAALLAEGPQQIGRDRAAPVALAAVHDLARLGSLDHELGCDHVLLSDATAATSQPWRQDWRVVCSSALSTSAMHEFSSSRPLRWRSAALPRSRGQGG